MESSHQLAQRIREVFLNGRWIANTNFRDQLSDLSLEKATQQIPPLNTIAALTFHINYYLVGLLQVLAGGPLDIRDQFSFDLPPMQSDEDWDKLVNDLHVNAEKFAEQLENMSEEQLAATFVKEKYGTYRRNIEGVIEHSYYHLGQISLLKKLINKAE